MKRKLSLFVFSFALILSLGSIEQILACSCVANISTCQRYSSSALIFIGKAIDVVKDAAGGETYGNKESTVFEVEEMFLGAGKKQFTVKNKSGSSCDISFEHGKTYLIFADGDEKTGFDTGYCSGNKLISGAGEMLDELRDLPKAGSGGKLYGQVTESLKKRDEQYVPMPGVKIKIQEVGGKRKIYNVVTDKEGKYELIVPQGKYRILPTIPAYADVGYLDEDPIFVKDRGCTEESFGIENKSKISGKVVDSDGNPVSKIWLELLSLDRIQKPNWLDDDGGTLISTEDKGVFTLENIPAGKYTLSVNYVRNSDEESPFPTTFYSNSTERSGATILEVGLGQSISEIVFRLPPRLAQIKVHGSVVWEDGTPAANIYLHLESSEFPGICVNDCNDKTDADGNFVLLGYSGHKYRIKAAAEKQIDGMKEEYIVISPLFSIDENPPQFKLVLKRSEEKDN